MKKSLTAVAALIRKERKYLLAQRKKNDYYGSLWEFPGGAVEKKEGLGEAIEREMAEELGVEVKAGPVLGEFFDQNRQLKLKIFLISCRIEKNECRPLECQDFGFFTLKEIEELSLAPADKKIFNYLKRGQGEKRITPIT